MRRIQSRTGAGASDIVTRTEYNRTGKPERLLGPAHLSPSYAYGARTDTDADDRITQTTYDNDPLLWVARVIPPGHAYSTSVRTTYGFWSHAGGQQHSFRTVVDEKGVATTNRFDPYRRLIYAIADDEGSDLATGSGLVTYAHDALDRLTSTRMPADSATTTYAYDTLGRMTSRQYPDADGAAQYKYDGLGIVRYTQDAQ